jgi:hypothetical protein
MLSAHAPRQRVLYDGEGQIVGLEDVYDDGLD